MSMGHNEGDFQAVPWKEARREMVRVEGVTRKVNREQPAKTDQEPCIRGTI